LFTQDATNDIKDNTSKKCAYLSDALSQVIEQSVTPQRNRDKDAVRAHLEPMGATYIICGGYLSNPALHSEVLAYQKRSKEIE